ncbi:MAG TPA: type II toxin-antitoxin system PemK/MazF family toxin [Gemmatimonadaceae bacterium]|nr:type II toxin-antitoxin system PemK/MazF family toxin [Gemmatimonadaceae bacterium]
MAVVRPARVPSRGEVYLVELEPTRGSEIRKTRPCLIVSPDELNHHLHTAIVAPMTTGGYAYPFRPVCRFAKKEGRVALDQLRTVDRERLRKRLGTLTPATLAHVFATLGELFEFP